MRIDLEVQSSQTPTTSDFRKTVLQQIKFNFNQKCLSFKYRKLCDIQTEGRSLILLENFN